MVTNVELAYRNQRHPFQDRRCKALWWWLAVTGLDAIVAVLALLGVLQVTAMEAQPDIGQIRPLVSGVIVGVLGPLGLRAPIRTAEVGNRDSQVGLTYVYDIARLHAIYALDERFVRLRRLDVLRLREAWRQGGIGAELVADELRHHVADHGRLSVEDVEAIKEAVDNSLTLIDETQQMDALIKLMRAHRFTALIDEFCGRATKR